MKLLFIVVVVVTCSSKRVLNVKPLSLEQTIKDKQHLFANFFTTDCGFCKLLNPIFEQAAVSLQKLHNKTDIFVQIDTQMNEIIAKQYGIDGFPKLKYFQNGQITEYEGNRNHQDLFNFVLRRLGIYTTQLNDQQEYDEFMGSNEVIGLLFNQDLLPILNTVVHTFDHVIFARVTNSSINVTRDPNVHFQLYKQLDNQVIDFTGIFSTTSVINFLKLNSYPNIMIFDDKAVEKIFHQGEAGIFLLLDSKTHQEIENTYRQAALKLKDKIIFCIASKEKDLILFTKLADYLGPEHLPAILINKSHNKYLLEGEITVANIETFVKDFDNRDLVGYHKTEKVPLDDGKLVKTLVGSTFEKIVVQSKKNFCVTFYQEGCSHCQRYQPIFEKVATLFQHVVSFGIIDITKNDLKSVQIPGYPTTYLYREGEKDSPIQFFSEKNEENLIKFFEMYLTNEKKVEDL